LRGAQWQGNGAQVTRNNVRWDGGNAIADYVLGDPRIRGLYSPLTSEQLRPLDPRCEVVQFSAPLTDAEYVRVAAFMRDYPSVTLRAYGFYSIACDLRFLRHFGSLRRFRVDVTGLEDLSGIEYLSPDLEYFGFGLTVKKTHSLAFLERFTQLKSLFIEGHHKDIDVLAKLTTVEDIILRSITLPDLSLLTPMAQLRSLNLKLGGTRDIRLLPEIGRLRYFEAWLVRGLNDLSAVAEVPTLQFVFLQALKQVESLPSFATLPILRRVVLDTMKGLTDLQPVADAPALEELLVYAMPQLTPGAFAPFVGHPTLRQANIGLGSVRKNAAVQEVLGLPRLSEPFVFM
jgi:hypothetical protein